MKKLYVKRKRGRRGLINVENAVNVMNSLKKTVCDSKEALPNEVKRLGIVDKGKEKKEIDLERGNAYRVALIIHWELYKIMALR